MKFKRGLAVFAASMMAFNCTAFAGVVSVIPKGGTVAIEQEDTEDEVPARVITYEEAVEMAIKNNSSLKELKEQVEDLEEQQENIGYALYTQTIPGIALPTTTYLDSMTANLLTSLNMINATLDTLEYSEQITKESCELIVKSYMAEIIQSENSLDMMGTNVKMSRQTDYFTRIKYDLGMISETEFNKAINDSKTTEYTYELSKLAVQTSYNKLSRIIGLNNGEKYTIEYAPEYELYPVQNNIEAFVERKLANDPMLKIEDVAVQDAEFRMKFVAIDNGDNYETRNQKLEKAGRSYNDKKRDLELAIKNGYITVKQAEGNIETLKLTLENTQKQYDNAVISHELGYVTEVELMGAKLALTKAESDVQMAILSHDMAKFMLDHPYLGTSSASQQ